MELRLPSTIDMLKDLELFDKIIIKHGMAPSFPMLCFESSLFTYLYIKSRNKNCNATIKYGLHHLGPNKEDILKHCWLEFKNKIIDYTVVQVIFRIPMSLYGLTRILAEINYDITEIPYTYDIEGDYSVSIDYVFPEHLDLFVKSLLNKNIELSIKDIIYAYEQFLNSKLSFNWSGKYYQNTGLEYTKDIFLRKYK